MSSQTKEKKSESDEFGFASMGQMPRMMKMCCPDKARSSTCSTWMQKAAERDFCCVSDEKSIKIERTKK